MRLEVFFDFVVGHAHDFDHSKLWNADKPIGIDFLCRRKRQPAADEIVDAHRDLIGRNKPVFLKTRDQILGGRLGGICNAEGTFFRCQYATDSAFLVFGGELTDLCGVEKSIHWVQGTAGQDRKPKRQPGITAHRN